VAKCRPRVHRLRLPRNRGD